jgi:hypothetical protein
MKFLLVTRLCLVTQIRRLCLPEETREAEPLDIGSQAEPRNQLNDITNCLVTQIRRLCLPEKTRRQSL